MCVRMRVEYNGLTASYESHVRSTVRHRSIRTYSISLRYCVIVAPLAISISPILSLYFMYLSIYLFIYITQREATPLREAAPEGGREAGVLSGETKRCKVARVDHFEPRHVALTR
jgi:hypothetical protein